MEEKLGEGIRKLLSSDFYLQQYNSQLLTPNFELLKMRTKLFISMCLFGALTASGFAQNLISTPPPGLEGTRDQVAQKLLESKDEALFVRVIQLAEDTENIRYIKMIAAKRLSVYGTEKSIPALIQMLSQPEMGYYSRYALEPMPLKAVDEALREATKTQKDMNLVGVLTTIGVRRDAGAIPFITPLLTHANPEVVRAAYASLGYIGKQECADVLTKAVGDFKPEYEKAVCDATLFCAKLLIEDGKIDTALALYDAIINSKARPFLKEGAIYNRILARKEAGTNDLIRYLQSENAGIFASALRTVRFLPGGGNPSVCKALTAEFDKFPPQRKGLILEALAGRKDDESRKAALGIAVAVKEPAVVRVSAMNALGTLDIPEAVPALLAGAADNNGQSPVADAAFRALVFMTNKDADAAIAKAMLDAGNKIDAAMIRIAKERRTVAATPQLWTIIKTANSSLRNDAIDALGETATLKDLPEVAKLIATVTSDGDRTRIATTLSAICARMPQQASFDTILAILNTGESLAVQQAAIDMMKTIGGKAAVDKVTEIALGNNAQLADKATQVLGTWDSPDTMDEIAESLLKVAKQSSEERFQIRGIRGYIRLARQFSYPEDKRIAMIKTAFDTAARVDDKNLIFDIFARYPSLKMVEAALSYASNEAHREQACKAAVDTATRLQGRQPLAARIMDEVIRLTKTEDTKTRATSIRDKLAGVDEGVEIVKAIYGAGDKTADVTAKVRDFSGGNTILEIGSYNDAFGDVAPQVVKTLKITYKIKGGPEKTVEFAENASIVLQK